MQISFGPIFGFAGAGLAATCAHAGTQTVIQDTFTSGSQYGVTLGAQGKNAEGVAPEPVNLPGSVWQHISGAFYDTKVYSGTMNGAGTPGSDQPADFVTFHNGAASGIALGQYNAGNLHITIEEHATSSSMLLAGFSSVLNSGSNYGTGPVTGFTGLALTSSSGALQEFVNGTAVGNPIPYGGKYDPDAEAILSYTINTATGEISEVTFGHSRAIYAFPTPKSFSKSYTANAELGVDVGGLISISSFILSSDAVENPATDGKQVSAISQ
jgi:hypothetical protein